MWCSLQVSQSRRALGSLCSGWWLTQSLTLVQVPVKCWALNRHWYHNYHHHHYPKHDERGGRKIVRARGWVGMLWNSLFWTWQGYGTHELIATVVNCTRSSQDQANQYSNVGRGGAHKASAQAEEWLAVDCYWKGKSFIFKGMALAGCPCLNGWSHICAHMASIKWTRWMLGQKKGTWSWEVACVGGGSGRSWRGQWRVHVIKITVEIYKILKE